MPAQDRSIASRILGITYVLVCSILVFRPPAGLPPGVGLDPSWTIGIARAAQEHLVFGRDIVFSYGPLGYLVVAIADVGNTGVMAALQLAVATLIFVTVVEGARATKFGLAKVLLLALAPVVVSVVPSDIWSILFILSAFALHLKPREGETVDMLALGLFAGLFALTKFTVAIDVALVYIAFFSARAWAARREGTAARMNIRGALTFAIGAIGASEYKFVSVDAGRDAALIILILGVGVAGAAAWYRFRKRTPLDARIATAAMAFSALLVFVSAIASPAYRTFIATYLAVAEGYSTAHSFEGPAWQVASAVWWLSGLLVIAWAMRKEECAPIAMALLVFEWAIFKLGFVRQDLHVLNFFAGSAFAALILTFSARRKQSLIMALMLLASTAFPLERIYVNAGWEPIITHISLNQLADNADKILHLRNYSDGVDKADLSNVRGDLLPADMVRAIGMRPVDAAPVETGFVFANNLHWDPEPVFQTIMAYSPGLDEIDRNSLEDRRNDAILYSLGSMDNRFPNGDQPSAFSFMLCHYSLSATSSERPAGPILLLRANRSRCGDRTAGSFHKYEWNQTIAIPRTAERMTLAHIRISQNLAGRALTAAFRSPAVYVTVGFDDGSSHRYRVVIETGMDGVLVDPVAHAPDELAKLFSGDLAPNARTLRFETDARWFTNPEIAFDSLIVRRE